MESLSLLVFVASSTYLVARVFVQIRRQQRSYQALPFPSRGWRLEGAARATSAADPRLPDLLDRKVGALVGIAVGDALGAPRESLPVWLCNLRYGRKPALSRGIFRFMRRRGTVTDDTQQTWLVAQATGEDGFDVEKFRASLLDWYRWRIGPGRGTEQAIRAIKKGDKVASESQGNGASMRVAPLAVRYCADPERLRDAVAASAAVTHPNAQAVYGAQLVAEITRCFLVDEPLPTEGSSEEWTRMLTAPKLVTPTGWIYDTVECALALYHRHEAAWEQGLEELFTLGGDTDTVGAIYCSWVGAKCGASCFGDLASQVQGTEILAGSAFRLMD